ncbi:MAG: hypothetical protein QG558_16, partial [Campylobacterota bacterium]|nr:hypothetical protein [Campylobacterota bacterium]
KGLTDAEHKSLGSYSIGDVVKFGKEYYCVVMKESDTKSILLKDEFGKTKYFYPEKRKRPTNNALARDIYIS